VGYTADLEGVVQPGLAVPLQLPTAGIAPARTDDIDMEFNLDSRLGVTDPGAAVMPRVDFSDATTYNKATSLTVYDTKGKIHNLSISFLKTEGNGMWGFDAKLDKLLEWKRGLSTDMLNVSGDVGPADFGDLEAPDGGNAFGNELLDADDIRSMDADAFEAFCALLWSKRGYTQVLRTPKSGDGGVDVVATRGVEGVVIQCKSSSIENRELGWDAVKDVAAGVAAYAQRYPSVQFSMVAATNQRFNGTARQQAQILSVELIEGEDLLRLLVKYPVKRGELEQFMFANW
jgi:flagellar hook protein FlgE